MLHLAGSENDVGLSTVALRSVPTAGSNQTGSAQQHKLRTCGPYIPFVTGGTEQALDAGKLIGMG